MADGLLSPDDMMLDNTDPGAYVAAPIYGLLSGLYDAYQIPGRVLTDNMHQFLRLGLIQTQSRAVLALG